MSSSKSNQESQGKNFGQKLSKADAERKAFHRQQMQNPEILMPNLDPDKPVLLGELQRFDELICTRLRMLGYPGTGNGDRQPQSCRPMVLARKMAGNPASISQADIAVLADRIGWLQRNCFRWSVRNGYAEYFASRYASRLSDNSGKVIEVAASDAAPPEGRKASSKSQDGHPRHPNAAIDDAFAMIKKLDEQVAADLPITASASSVPASEVSRVYGTGSASDRLGSAGSSGGSEWTSWAGEVRRRRPETVPQMPQRPKTFGKEFPIPKAKALLVAVAVEQPIAEQICKAELLLEDRAELYAALKHGNQAQEDLLNILAYLGLEL